MKVSIKKYLLYSSVFAIFTEAFFFNFIIDWKLLYLIIIVNYFLIIRIQKTIRFNKYFIFIILGLLIHGLITNIIIGVPINYMFSQLIGITIIATYYYNFTTLYDRNEIIEVYTKLSLIVAAIGYPMWLLNINVNDGIRLQSIFKEPAHYVIVVLPACYYFLKTKRYWPFLIILGTIILSSSSIGYFGIGLMFILPNITFKRIKYLFIITPILVGAFVYVYSNYEFFKLRADDTYKSLNAFNTGKFEEYTNLSTYAILSNAFVAKENVSDHPLGSGIGSHYYMHTQQYIKDLRIPPYIIINDSKEINAKDACSLFLRMCSDLGIIGFLFIVVVLVYVSKAYRNNKLIFAQAVVIYLLLKLFRDGHYFPPEMYFFIWLLYFELKDYGKSKNNLIN
ncbi:O-antigen ligase-like membrane protein [Flavobacterium endophyticum]|uniref:O-antigen ligase-like membrane protein n=2 Tax=Flavobacterium endophyticum TaxID=1540163 RepID=A0A495MLZ9_9FLAO|nr:O-antigen ligase-like membrane protein [Flavobacterium endophyticum]